MKLVIADDERRIRMLLKGLIPYKELGLEPVAEASNGLEALELCEKYKPEILVTDINMPGLSGLELIKILKQQLPEIKMIIISGYSDFEYAKTAIKYGVYDYILKPVDEGELTGALLRAKAAVLKEKEAYEEKLKEIKSPQELSSYINLLAGDILKLYCTSNDISPVEIAKRFVEKNYPLNISLEQLAGYVHLNPTYLCSLFKKETGSSFVEYRTLIRIQNAKKLLAETDLSVSEISTKTGYNDTKHFLKLFKRIVGVTPSEFKQNNRNSLKSGQ